MIVSIAMAVFPVWRSPMISWRWPRPIGIMASIALMPVCSGSSTLLRLITSGAWSSSSRRVSASIGPRPSIGLPSGSITRPRNASPTGTDSTSPVRSTRMPSAMPTNSPSTTTPISCSSRFWARPSTPFSKRTSSLAWTLGSPSTWAMPSAALSTYPTSAFVEEAGWYSSVNSLRAPRISSGLIATSAIIFLTFGGAAGPESHLFSSLVPDGRSGDGPVEAVRASCARTSRSRRHRCRRPRRRRGPDRRRR
jgi:hypothetical protein